MKIGEIYLERIAKGEEDAEKILQDLLDYEGDPDYIDSFSNLCEIGGYPDEDCDPSYRVLTAEIKHSTIIFDCEVFFDEKIYQGGCPDMPTTIPRTGIIKYKINLESGELNAVSSLEHSDNHSIEHLFE